MTTFNDYQKQARTTAIYIQNVMYMLAPIYKVVHASGDQAAIEALDRTRYTILMAYAGLGAAGEAGEIANKISKVIRGDGPLDGIPGEMGGNLWYLAELASLLNVDFDDIAGENLEVLADRMARNVIKGSGDER